MISIVMMIIVLKTAVPAVPAVTAAAAHGSHSPTFASWAAPQKGLSQLQRVKQNEKSCQVSINDRQRTKKTTTTTRSYVWGGQSAFPCAVKEGPPPLPPPLLRPLPLQLLLPLVPQPQPLESEQHGSSSSGSQVLPSSAPT